MQLEIFQGRGGFVKLGTSINILLKSIFSLRYSYNYILDGKFNLRMDTIRAFFSPNQGTIFDFQKGAGETSPSPTLVTRLKLKNANSYSAITLFFFRISSLKTIFTQGFFQNFHFLVRRVRFFGICVLLKLLPMTE